MNSSKSQQYQSQFDKDMSELRSLYTKYQKESGDETPIPEDNISLFVEWALHIHEYYEEDLHSGKFKRGEILNNKTCFNASSRDIFFKSYFPPSFPTLWPIRFTRKFIRKFGEIKEEVIQRGILTSMLSCGRGNLLQKDNPDEVNGLSYMDFKHLYNNRTLIRCVHVERYPEFDTNNKVKAWNYMHVLRFLDLLNDNEKTSTDVCLSFLEQCKKDPARQEFQPKRDEVKTGYTSKNRTYTSYLFQAKESSKGEIIVKVKPNETNYDDEYGSSLTIIPNTFKMEFLTPEEIQDLIYVEDLHRWVPKKEYTVFERRQGNALASKVNAEILERFADFESSGKLVNLLEKMQSLKLKLTPEERRLIGESGNVLAIGRSGTGKTTCCVLRLFAQDLLFKIRLAQAQVKEGILRDTRHMADQMDNLIGIHSIFITASPVLTNEVRRYYENLSNRIKQEMKKKEKSTGGTPNTSPTKEEAIIASNKSPKKENVDKKEEENKQEESFEEEEDYLMDEEEVEAQAKFSKNYAFDGIEDKEFPLFLTLKRVILMIDGTLQKPFFARKKDNSIIGSDTKAQWHNEAKGLMMISDKYREQNGQEGNKQDDTLTEHQSILEDKKDVIEEEDKEEDEEEENQDTTYKVTEADIEAEYERYLAVQAKKREQQRLDSEMKKKNNMNFEVDYEYFYNHFWMRYLSPQDRPKSVTPALVWSEIMSTIKGSPESHVYPNYHLPSDVYISLPSEDNNFLGSANRTTIHRNFMYYEEWKLKEGGYDFMDVVNHVLNEVRLRGYNGAPIHFTMIDEIQDLSHATILLLMKVTEQSVFFAGDTAQTIAKGVGVRFSDLSSLFKLTPEKEYLWKRPTVHQLTVNFRSHSKILDMANSVVTLIETFFPKTIDKLKKEKSEVDGPKPILLDGVDLEVLFALLFGNENFKSNRHSQNQGGALEKPPIEFGCNQAIIVRDQDSKNKLPPMLKHALCLTVYEAKGLEFDDVILYNFFSDSLVSEREWQSLMGLLEIESKEVDKDTFDRFYFTYKPEDLSDLSSESVRKSSEDNTKKKDKEDLDLQAPNLFNAHLDEKKNKYTIQKVTVPKRSLAMIDFETCSSLCNELKQLYVALTRPRNRIIIFDDKIEKRQHIEKYWKQLSLVQVISKAMLQTEKADNTTANKDLESFKSLLVSTGKDEWKKQGLRMFRNKYYEQAAMCFEKAGEEKLHRRALAYMIAEKASSNLNKIKSEHATLTQAADAKKAKGVEAKEKNARLKKLKADELECYDEYEKAAVIFTELDLLKQASQCYFSAGKYEKALEISEKLGLPKEAGEACVMLKEYEKAAEMFSQGGDLVRAIDCYEMVKDYDKILAILPNLTDLSPEQRKMYGRKYVPLALQRLTHQVQFQSPEKPKNEKDLSSGDEDSDKDQEKETIVLKKGLPEEEVKIEPEGRNQQQKKNVEDMSFEVIDKPQEGQKNLSNMSFENVEDMTSDFEHLSQYDLKDEFLKNDDLVSVIDSIKSFRRQKSFTESEYSAIDQHCLIDSRYQLVQTKGDIFIQDSIMRKIISYIGLFSDDMKKNLDILCSKDAIVPQESGDKASNLYDFIDLDNLSLEVIHFVLDFLEQNRLYKLCIFVCNRYNLAGQLGRYLVNIAFQYSTLASEDIRANPSRLFNVRSRQILQEKAFVANKAVHNILEIINPNFLKLKKKEEQVNETNNLGDNSFRSLISLGFWKKCLFMMDYANSLALASTFASFENYKLIFLTGSNTYNVAKENIQALVEDEGFKFLPFMTPQNKEEANAAIVGLESVIWELSEKLPIYLYKKYKPVVKNSNQVKVPEFPSYFSYNAALWNFVVNKEKDQLTDSIKRVPADFEYLLKNQNELVDELELFDLVSFLMQLSLLYSNHQPVSDLVNEISTSQATELIKALKKLMEFTSRAHLLLKSHEEVIIRAILSPLRIRYIEKSSVLSGFGLHRYLVHQSSPIVGDLLATEHVGNPTLVFDVEANFLLAPISVCFVEIKKNMALIIDDMNPSEEDSDHVRVPSSKDGVVKKNPVTKGDVVGLIEKKLGEVLAYYAKASLQNPIDFHYISNTFQKLVTCELEYLDRLREGEVNKDAQNERMYKVEGIGQEFEVWRVAKESQGNGEEKSLKKKILARATWEEQALIAKMQKIAKKRKEIKKQDLKETRARMEKMR